MANIKSAKKRILVNQTRYERNKSVKSAIKTATKKVEAAVANKDKETAAMIFSLSSREKMRDKVISLFHEKYGIEGEMPFSDDNTSIVFRSLKNKKWIGIMMDIPSSKLNIPGEENVDVINLKHSQSMIPSLIDNRVIFPAWHMNKKTWITVLLSPDLDWDFFSSLLEESRRLVEERT